MRPRGIFDRHSAAGHMNAVNQGKGKPINHCVCATNRNVPQIGFAPDWTKHGRAAPFKRNDEMLEIVPKGVMHFPGTGINDNLADKAKKLGIPVWKFGGA